MSRAGAKKRPLAKKDTFWNRKRIESNIKYTELGELLHMPLSTVGSYFSGQVMPKREFIEQVCDLFGVEYSVGVLEFQHAHRAWRSNRNDKTFLRGEPPKKKSQEKPQPIVLIETVEEEPVIDYKTKFLKAVYGCVSYEQYEELKHYVEVEGADTLRYLYGKIDYDLYQRISSLLSEESEEPMF